MRCIECEEIELARVSDARPSQKMPVPYAALDGFPAGRTPRDLTRRRLLQWGVAGMASIYGAKELGWDAIWESVAAANAAEEKCLVLLYLAGGNDGLNVLIPERSRRLGVLPGRAAGDPPHARSGLRHSPRLAAAARPGRRRARVRQPRRLRRRQQRRRELRARQAVRQRHRRGRLGSRGHARSRRQAVQPEPLRQLGHLVQGLQRPERQDGLARALDRPQRQRHEPAAGDLDRHRALEGDPHARPTRCARSPRCRSTGSCTAPPASAASTTSTSTRRCATSSGLDADDENAYLGALARDVRSRGRDLAAAQRDHVGDPDADRDAAPAGDRLSEPARSARA